MPAVSRASSVANACRTVPRLSVVVVNYHQWENTAALARQVRSARSTRKGDVEVVVVDNHSPRRGEQPHRLMKRLRRWPEVSLLRWGRNRGFARAVNEGCRLSQGRWFLLLNPDVSVTPEFMEGVLALADRLDIMEPKAGIVGFQLHNADGSEQLSAGAFPTLVGSLAGLILPRRRRKYQATNLEERGPVPWVTGCCLLVRGDCWRDLGGFDESFFLYYEDVDFCRRARERGWSVSFEPSLNAVHQSPLHGRAVPASLRLIIRHSLLTYAARHWPSWQVGLLARIVRLEAWGRRLWAAWRKDESAARLFQELAAIGSHVANGSYRKARRRLNQIVQQNERGVQSAFGPEPPANAASPQPAAA